MPNQLSFESGGFEKFKKKTRREKFLEEMEAAVPWKKLLSIIEPFYHPSPGPQGGRPAAGLSKMFRIHCLQHWFTLSDPAVEDALHESPVLRRFVGIDLGVEPVPDETTIMRFRHLLEEYGLSKDLFEGVNDTLRRKGLMLKKGTIVDAAIIDAPSSTKNEAKERDPEMCQTKKGNQWYFGMKLHIGVDERSTLIHSLDVTAANVSDANCIANLLHGEEESVWGDQGYAGRTDVIACHAAGAVDRTNRRLSGPKAERERERNRQKSKIRAKVEHPFLTIKRTFGFTKTRLRGMLKNTERLYLTCALANLHRVRYRLAT